MADEGSTADNMMKGRGIAKGFKTVGQGLQGEESHPEVTGIDPTRKGPGRPPKGESSFTQVGKTVEQEQSGGNKPE